MTANSDTTICPLTTTLAGDSDPAVQITSVNNVELDINANMALKTFNIQATVPGEAPVTSDSFTV